MSMSSWRTPLVRIGKYAGIDIVLFPLNIALAWLLTEAGLDYRLATAAGFFMHISLAFFLNRRWTFHSHIPATSGLLKTWLIGASDLVLAVAFTTLLVEQFGLTFLIGRILAAFVVFGWDYVLNTVLTFKAHVFR